MKTKIVQLKFVQPAVTAALAIAITFGLLIRNAQADYIVTLQQVGSNVVATGSGAFNLTGLTFDFSFAASGIGISASTGSIGLGPFGTVNADFYSGFTGPTSFGSGGFVNPNAGSGDYVFMKGSVPQLVVPQGYVSGTVLSDSIIFNSATLSSLGVTPGTYVWSWGTGANQKFTLDAVAPPAVPDSGSTLGLLLVASSGLFAVSRFRQFRLA